MLNHLFRDKPLAPYPLEEFLGKAFQPRMLHETIHYSSILWISQSNCDKSQRQDSAEHCGGDYKFLKSENCKRGIIIGLKIWKMGRLEIEMKRNLPVPLWSGSSDQHPPSQLSFGAVGIDTDNLPKQQNQDGRPPRRSAKESGTNGTGWYRSLTPVMQDEGRKKNNPFTDRLMDPKDPATVLPVRFIKVGAHLGLRNSRHHCLDRPTSRQTRALNLLHIPQLLLDFETVTTAGCVTPSNNRSVC